MVRLSIVSHFYNHLDQVLRQLERWRGIDPALLAQVEFILVDDHSDQALTLPAGNLDLRVFRVETDIDWNQAGARNLGALMARGEWGLFFDIDQALTPEALPVILHNLDRLERDTMYALRAHGLYNDIDQVDAPFHANTFLVHLPTFRRLGMYDEDFAGHYGYEDIYMPLVWQANGGKRVLLSEPCFFDGNLGFRTERLDRSLERNKALGTAKLVALQSRQGPVKSCPSHLLRFEWREMATQREATGVPA